MATPTASTTTVASSNSSQVNASSTGGQLGGLNDKCPILMYIEYNVNDPEKNLPLIRSSFNTICKAHHNPANPRPGTITYALCKSIKDDDNKNNKKVYFLETFSDFESQSGHITENEAAAIEEMYSKEMIRSTGGISIGIPEQVQEVRAVVQFQVGIEHFDPIPGFDLMNTSVFKNKWYKRYPNLKPKVGCGVLFEFQVIPKDDDNHSSSLSSSSVEEAIKAAKDVLDFPPDTTQYVSKFILPHAYYHHEKNAAAPGEFCFFLLYHTADHLKPCFPRKKLTKLVSESKSVRLNVTAENWNSEELETILEYFADNDIHVAEQRKVIEGFLLNPYHTQNWDGIMEEYKANLQALANKKESSLPFKVRYHVTKGTAEALELISTKVETSAESITIPLIHLLRKIAFLSRNDNELPLGMVYAQLARLRGLLGTSKRLNDAPEEELSNDEELKEEFRSFLDFLSSLGYSMPATGRVPVLFEGLEGLVSLIEGEFEGLIDSGREARNDQSIPIPYMSMQELFKKDDVIVTNSIGGLGGVPIALKVIDAFYEPIRSIYGGRKYSFRLILESILPLSGEFASVRFQHIFEEWKGEKVQSTLPYKRLIDGSEEMLELQNRVRHVEQVNSSKFSYHQYSGGCFYPHSKGNGSLGGASSGDSRAAAGRLVVDSVRGCALGHSPANSNDELGLSIAATTKALRNIQSALSKDSSKAGQREERLISAGIRIYSKVTQRSLLICWPAVVAFSLTMKQWGHVLIDGLSPVEPDEDAWDQLVLPAETKEMLLAMTSVKKAPRYKFHDVVESKGSGVLFLLYGPPGTGKSLTVAALAAKFGRPLYSISFAELGSSVAELEERLTDVLALAAQWKALVLLDEGDALVEKRQKGQFLLNSMTGVLLRLLESFEGALFITSNRASSFDPAALSRVTLAIRYEALGENARREIWGNSLRRILRKELGDDGKLLNRSESELSELIEKQFDLDKLKKIELSGRAVGAILRLAIGLCHQRNCELDQKIIDSAMTVFEAFTKDLKDDGAQESWE